jgi:LSD1 subclass zinc finger protein
MRITIMDRIVIQCKKCGRLLSALPTMKSRKCAACGATTKVLAFQREKAVPIRESAEAATGKAKKMQFDPGKTTVVKRRAARSIADEEGGDA